MLGLQVRATIPCWQDSLLLGTKEVSKSDVTSIYLFFHKVYFDHILNVSSVPPR